jgi:hypothetical protein
VAGVKVDDLMKRRLAILIGAVLLAGAILFFVHPIRQNEAYHDFADKRAMLGIPNGLDVISNLLFLIVGVLGFKAVWRDSEFHSAKFERPVYVAFFVGVTLTAFGSSWYHLNPNDATLVWDRLPMAIGFMALVAAIAGERICPPQGVGLALLMPLVALGVGSVLDWAVRDDLRSYAFAQFGSLLVLVLLIALFPVRYTRTSDLGISLGLYALAKVFEYADRPIFAALKIVSGHTLKHLAAALSAYCIVRMLQLRRPIQQSSDNP